MLSDQTRVTYPPMAYVSYAVTHDFLKYSDIPRLTHDHQVRDSLRTLAYINIKKFPGGTSSYGKNIQYYYNHYEPFLIDQIERINPDVVIFGGTYKFFSRRLNLGPLEKNPLGPSYLQKDGRLYISAYHPDQRTIGKNIYVEGIVSVIKSNKSVETTAPATPSP